MIVIVDKDDDPLVLGSNQIMGLLKNSIISKQIRNAIESFTAPILCAASTTENLFITITFQL